MTLLIILLLARHVRCSRPYDRHRLKQLRCILNNLCLLLIYVLHIINLRSEVKEMFEHAYHGYMKYAYPYDELRPLTCDGVDTWGRYNLQF